ncbi:MAG TPA: type II secretion system protein GspL [Geobacteraceae bacterium]|nr:type II secretion system protein GspL [Geobacteraceae bacterium]
MNYLIVQLTGNEALFARFQLKRGVLVFDRASRETIDQEHPLAAMLAEAAAAGREGERVILVIPPSLLSLREMELTLSDRRKIREVLPLELKGETACDSEELVFDALPLDGGKVLAIWGKRHDLGEKIAIMTDNGLEPEIVTASLFHWHALLPEGESGGHVALSDGESLAVYRNGKPCYFRALHQGEADAEVARTLAALEIGKGVKVEKVLLHGAAAHRAADLPAGPPAFAVLPCNREMATLFGGDAAAIGDLAGAYAVARASALEEPVNFRRGSLAYTAGRKKTLKKLRISLILAAACVVLLMAETAVRYFQVRHDLDSVNNSIKAIYREVFPSRKKPVDEVAELRAEIKRLGGGAATGNLLLSLARLAEIKGADVTGLFEVEVDGGQLRVRGDARSIQAVNDFRTRGAAVFAGAEVGEIKSRPDGSVTFSFRGTMKEEGR